MGAGCSGYSSNGTAATLVQKVPVFKVVIVGDPEVGKTNVFLRYMKNQYDEEYKPTKSVEIHHVVRKVNVPQNTVVAVTMWDLPGREDIDLRKTYYQDIDAAIVVVDVTNEESIEMAGTWKHEICNNATIQHVTTENDVNGQTKTLTSYIPAPLGSIPVMLFGNKYDLIEKLRNVRNAELIYTSSSDVTKGNEKTDMKVNGRENNCDVVTKQKAKITEIDSKHKMNKRITDLKTDDEIYAYQTKIPDTYKKDGNVGDEFFEVDPINKTIYITNENNNNMIKKSELAVPGKQADQPEVPGCLKLLEEVEEAYGFISSFPVSAKNTDGDIDVAVQALIRHLIEKRGKDFPILRQSKRRYNFRDDKASSVKSSDSCRSLSKSSIQLLEDIGFPDLDNLFTRCQVPIEMAKKFYRSFKHSLKAFKRQCVSSGLVDNDHCSLEDCILRLRKALGEGRYLEAAESEFFVKLEVHGSTETIDGDLQKVLSHFNDQFSQVCGAILRDSPSASVYLEKINNMVKVCAEEIIERIANTPEEEKPADSVQNVPALVKKIDTNRAKIMHVQELIHKNVSLVEKNGKKVKTALMW